METSEFTDGASTMTAIDIIAPGSRPGGRIAGVETACVSFFPDLAIPRGARGARRERA